VKRPLVWMVRGMVSGAVIYGALFVYVLALAQRDDRDAVDAIVVLGAAHYNGRPSSVLRARLDHAAELFRADLAPVIIVTGGMAEGDRVSEATVSRQYLVGQRVPASAIVVLPVGRNSRESIASAAEWLRDHGLRSVVLVSDPFHMARLRAEAHTHQLAARTSPTRTSPISTRTTQELEYLAAEAAKLPVVWLRGLAP
jgi:uncharacterized SAM-binding protein YcdF (DUF218 family)